MSKKYVYQKNVTGVNDFVYVDLLPVVRRASQFNIKVIIAGTLAVVATYFFIFIPYRLATEEFEEVNGHNNDLQHRLALKQEERIMHDINLDIIAFEQDILFIESLGHDVNITIDDIYEAVNNQSGELIHIHYDAEYSRITVQVIMINDHFSNLEDDFLSLDFVYGVQASDEEDYGDAHQMVQFDLEVMFDVE